jgi:curved DNA-binding protein CbpA
MAGSLSVPSSKTSDSAYSILEVESSCSVEDLRASYKRLILLHHPDKLNGSSQLFQKVQIAWKLVCTPEDRMKYDMTANSGVYGSSESIPISDFKESDDGESISKLCRCGGSYEVHTSIISPATA